MAKVVKGEVNMEVCYALDDDEVAEGYVLTCQAKPTTPEVEITFNI
jgi:ring-1,2-phenylacetyl-CoA epoxidase subunit PaaE